MELEIIFVGSAFPTAEIEKGFFDASGSEMSGIELLNAE
jgi:hypothetical protein